MRGLKESVDERTQLVGHNRLELLLFHLESEQQYGINVFKVREVIRCPQMHSLPQSNSFVLGVANIRGLTLPIVDLSRAIGLSGIENQEKGFVVICEYNGVVQGFLVRCVDRIINMNWEEINPPPKGLSSSCYLTAVTEFQDKLIEIIDVEKVLSELSPNTNTISEEFITEITESQSGSNTILVVDDSSVARKQVKKTLEQLGIEVLLANDGKEALEVLKNLADPDEKVSEKLLMVISDIEMPRMDGYTLTSKVREDSQLKSLYIVLHTSLSGNFNQAMVDKVGANDFIAKFNPERLANAVKDRIALIKE